MKIKDINQEQYLFTEEDYDVFDPELIRCTDLEINRKRNIVKSKLIKLHNEIYLTIHKEYKVDKHYNDKYITSLPYCNQHNNWEVHWLGLRYGQDGKIVKEMDKDIADNDPLRGFLMYQCYQINVTNKAFEISIYHSTPRNTYDRGYVHSKIDDKEYQQKLIDAINKLKGHGFIYYAGEGKFNIDQEEAENFIKFYNKYDLYGTYSSCIVAIPVKSRLLLKENIVTTCIDYIDLLSELFNVMRWVKNG